MIYYDDLIINSITKLRQFRSQIKSLDKRVRRIYASELLSFMAEMSLNIIIDNHYSVLSSAIFDEEFTCESFPENFYSDPYIVSRLPTFVNDFCNKLPIDL